MENEIVTAISTVGFPAAVCLYTLVKIDNTLSRLTDVITAMSAKIDTMTGIYNATAAEFDQKRKL